MGRTDHAVVLGSGMAGLAAAGVLAGRFARVTVVERDAPPEPLVPRQGVPQGRHVHILLKAGELALAETFPGIVDELEARGSHRINFGLDFAWYLHGSWKVRYDSPELLVRMQSRPMLEATVRQRLAGLGNVGFLYRTASCGLDVEGGRVRAVRWRTAEGNGEEHTEPADLVIDASGRGSQLSRWLAEAGFPAPREERLGVDLQYASRVVACPPDPAARGKAMLLYHTPPRGTRAGALFPIEGDRQVVTLAGYLGDHPPADGAGFLAFAEKLEQPDLYEALRRAEPLSPISTFRFPYARWLHFEELPAFPAGVLPLGDSIGSFDPLFGQGMSVAARQARALAAHLARDPTAIRPRSYLRAAARLVATPWLLAGSEDLRHPGATGRRPFWLPLLQAYTHRVFQSSETNAADYDRALQVIHLLAGPAILFHPGTLAWVVGGGGGGGGRAKKIG